MESCQCLKFESSQSMFSCSCIFILYNYCSWWNPDPTERHTVFGFMIGYMIYWLYFYGLNQAGVQRYSAVPTIGQSRAYVEHEVFLLWHVQLKNVLRETSKAMYSRAMLLIFCSTFQPTALTNVKLAY